MSETNRPLVVMAASGSPARPPTGGAWVAAVIVIAISLLSTFTIPTEEASSARDVSAGLGAPLGTEEESPQGTVAGGPQVVTRGAGPHVVTEGGQAGSEAELLEGQETTGQGSGGSQGNCGEGTNAGESEVGVKPDRIQFAATVVKTGIAKDFLSDAEFGIKAVLQKIKREGGICGRLVEVKFDDDGWDLAEGGNIIRKYIAEDKYFGLAVNPSSEGLLGGSGHVKAEGMPVIGADGMLKDQYENEWIWPVATSTHSVMHIMCQDAYERGARAFAIVYEGNYRFGVEGERAFSGCVGRQPGASMVKSLKIEGGKQGYQTEANDFVGACGGSSFSGCDFVALLLEPATATAWRKSNGMGNGSSRPRVGFGAPQPLFVNSFVEDCGAPCANLRVWTSFKPPIDPFDKDPAVAEYLNDLRAVSSSADASNPHVEGAYVGMLLLRDVLIKAGEAPTREKVKEILDSMTLDTGLAPPLTFAPGDHFAATSAQAFEAVYNITSGGAEFTGWRYTNSGFKNDDQVKQDL